MKKCVIVRYSEIGLKGPQTRRRMEKSLVSNIETCLKAEKIGFKKIIRGNARIIISTDDNMAAAGHLSRVFGVASSSPAVCVSNESDAMKKAALSFYSGGSFRISCRRITKSTVENSTRINEIIGAYIVGQKKAKVKLKNPDINIGIEIIRSNAYVFSETVQGPAGLPLGSQGTITCIIEESKGVNRSIISCYLMMKRGSGVLPLCFSKAGLDIAKHLHRYWMYGSRFDPELAKKTKDRKKMYRIAESAAFECGCEAIAVGEDVSNKAKDVNSLKKIADLDKSVSIMVLRPTIGYSEAQLKELHKKIMMKS
jgi:adenylyl- and sulfurtransferase ThiI